MKTILLGLFAILLLVPSASANGFTFRNGFWWRGGRSYTRTPCLINGCQSFRYVATPQAAKASASVNVNVGAVKDWRVKVLELAQGQQEQAYYIEAVKALGLRGGNNYGNGYGGGSYQLSQAGVNGSTVYGYNGFNAAAMYGDLNLNQLYQAQGRLADQAQAYGAEATGAMASLVDKAGQNQARVAAIIADSQAFANRMNALKESSFKVQTQSGTYGPAPAAPPNSGNLPGTPLPNDDEDNAKVTPLQTLVKAECLSCHNATTKKGNFDLTKDYLSEEEWNKMVERVFSPDPAKAMPRGADGKHKPLTGEQRKLFLTK